MQKYSDRWLYGTGLDASVYNTSNTHDYGAIELLLTDPNGSDRTLGPQLSSLGLENIQQAPDGVRKALVALGGRQSGLFPNGVRGLPGGSF